MAADCGGGVVSDRPHLGCVLLSTTFLDDDNGVSLERHDFNRPTQDEDNWHSAASTVLYATPGYQNSQVLVPSPDPEEVWLEPETFSPDQDGFEDVVSINYLFNLTQTVVMAQSSHKIGRKLQGMYGCRKRAGANLDRRPGSL